jgi:hypothetical protein
MAILAGKKQPFRYFEELGDKVFRPHRAGGYLADLQVPALVLHAMPSFLSVLSFDDGMRISRAASALEWARAKSRYLPDGSQSQERAHQSGAAGYPPQ